MQCYVFVHARIFVSEILGQSSRVETKLLDLVTVVSDKVLSTLELRICFGFCQRSLLLRAGVLSSAL